MGATLRDRVERVKAYTTIRLASAALALLATPIALVVPASADITHPELAGSITGYHLTGDDSFHRTSSAPDALARGASTTGGSDRRRPESAFSTTAPPPVMSGALSPSSSAQVVMSFRAAVDTEPNDVVLTLGAGSRLFSSHVPVSPMDGSSPSGSSGLAGVLALPSTGTVVATGAGRPPLPPYGRRATWTFRTVLTRPG